MSHYHAINTNANVNMLTGCMFMTRHIMTYNDNDAIRRGNVLRPFRLEGGRRSEKSEQLYFFCAAIFTLQTYSTVLNLRTTLKKQFAMKLYSGEATVFSEVKMYGDRPFSLKFFCPIQTNSGGGPHITDLKTEAPCRREYEQCPPRGLDFGCTCYNENALTLNTYRNNV